MKIIILDTETTGNGPDDRLVELCYWPGETVNGDSGAGSLVMGDLKTMRVLPPKPISIEAMSVHGITNGDVSACPAFQDTDEYSQLNDMFESGAIVVAHNAPFDVRILENEGCLRPMFIDTLRCARHLIDSPNYKLQYLRYFLGLDVSGAAAHSADGDVKILARLFDYLIGELMKDKDGQSSMFTGYERAVDTMVTLTTTPVKMKALPFGKYIGKSFEDVASTDRQYLTWLYSSEKGKATTEQNEDLIYTLKNIL